MTTVYARCTVAVRLPEPKRYCTFNERFDAEKKIGSSIIEQHGAAAMFWVEGDWIADKRNPEPVSLHTWMVACDENVLTMLALTCYNVEQCNTEYRRALLLK